MTTETFIEAWDYEGTYSQAMGVNPVPEGKISLSEMTELFYEMSNVKSFKLNNYTVHVGDHPNYGNIAVSQWAGEDYATLDVRAPGATLEFRPPFRCN